MNPKARRGAPQPAPHTLAGFLGQVNLHQTTVGFSLLLLLAFTSLVFVLNLSPDYGALTPHIFHNYGMGVVAIGGYFLKERVSRVFIRRTLTLLPVIAFWIPTIQYFFLHGAEIFGNPFGPFITDLVVFYPFVALSVVCARDLVQRGLGLDRYGVMATDHAPFLGLYVVYCYGERLVNAFLSRFLGSAFFLFSRAGLQLFIAILYAVAIPTKLLVLAIPSLIFSLFFNVHMPLGHATRSLNSSLQVEGFSLLARQDSVTGYISVLENIEDNYRIMRCDHSLLGGQWTEIENHHHPSVKEPVYAVFTMLEAVRLVETEQGGPRPDISSNALVIGLGAGTTPTALINHGVKTTIVEIDPVVHQFALDYFHLPPNHIAAIEDATQFVKRSKQSSAQYDYIVHDVFTGGAEPLPLFSIEFFRDLHSLLKPDGVIAINYAGDITLYPAGLIIRTILSIFNPNYDNPTNNPQNCRIFREAAPTSPINPNFTNMVIFCKKPASSGTTTTPLRFREPVAADYLGSGTRQTHLVPQARDEIDTAVFREVPSGGVEVLEEKGFERLAAFRDQGAMMHWRIMRGVLPGHVWGNW